MSEREKLYILILTEHFQRADAIILLAGDGYFRLPHTKELYKQKWAPKIIISGGPLDKDYGSFPPKYLVSRLEKMGVAKKDIIIEDNSSNTREQAVNIMVLAKQNKWKKIILVASSHHQLRAFLTFLKAMKEAKLRLQIINSPAQGLSWFAKNRWGRRIDWLEPEFRKIKIYRKHLANFSEAILYQEWKEKQK